MPPLDNAEVLVKSPLPSMPKKETAFRDKLTEKYNWFLHYGGGMTDQSLSFYEIPNFKGDWKTVSPEDYYAYRLSVKGVRPEKGRHDVSVQDVARALDEDKKIPQPVQNNLQAAREAFYGKRTPMEANDIIWVSETRMKEVIATEFPAAGAFKYGDHVGILLTYKEGESPTEFQAKVVHELGHFERNKSGKDDSAHDLKKANLEEGIVQANARKAAEKGGFDKAMSLTVYAFESEVADKLSRKLGVDSLMGYSHSEIEKLMNETPSMKSAAPNGYNYLIDNLDNYLQSVNEVDRAEKLKREIPPERFNVLVNQFAKAKLNIDKLLS